MKRLLTIMMTALALLLCSCQKETPDGAFLASEGTQLKINGRKILEYNPLNCQMSFNYSTRVFTVVSDNGADFYSIALSEIPYEAGEQVSGNLQWTSNSVRKSKNNVALDVYRVEGDRIWLWNAKLDIQVSLDILH